MSLSNTPWIMSPQIYLDPAKNRLVYFRFDSNLVEKFINESSVDAEYDTYYDEKGDRYPMWKSVQFKTKEDFVTITTAFRLTYK